MHKNFILGGAREEGYILYFFKIKHKYVIVRTTIDIPDILFKKMKIKVVESETTIKEFIIGLVSKELNQNANPYKYQTNLELKNSRKKGKVYKNATIDALRDELGV
jgi:hypothetical protein